jgi:hypothetical protein
VAFTTITPELKFSVHTGPARCGPAHAVCERDESDFDSRLESLFRDP